MAWYGPSSATCHIRAPLRNHRPRLIGGWALAAAAMLLAAVPVNAEEGDGWAVVLTPQVWLSHIDKNGFSSPPPLVIPNGFATDPRQFTVTSSPGSTLDPQWGTQIIVHKHPWAFGAAVQFVSFTTRYDIATAGHAVTGITTSTGPAPVTGLATPGQLIAQERIDSDRFDVDLALTYFVPDVVKDRLDLNVGFGVKVISASASRQLFNGHLPTAGGSLVPQQYLYVRCDDALTVCRPANKATIDDFLYGVTIPLNLAFAVTDDHRWTMKLNMSPFIGAETRNDHDVVYATQPGNVAWVH